MDLSPYLKLMTEKNGTDLFVAVGSPVTIKISGKKNPRR
jgi:twitching motility protein PilU